MPVLLDDLGFPVELSHPVRRVVSLVPSLTESVAVTRPGALAGATDWCTHPAGLDVPRVRGTKNPSLAAIRALRPGLVLANQEENRKRDVERLRAAGVPVWVTVIRTLEEALASLRRLFTSALGWPAPGWLADAERAWREPPPGPPVRAVIPVWRDPWMVVGSATFTGDLAARLGLLNVFGDHPGRYPHVTLDDIAARGPALVVLPDEPYAFTAADGPEAFPGRRAVLAAGRSLTWYGPSLVTARETLTRQLGLPARPAGLSPGPAGGLAGALAGPSRPVTVRGGAAGATGSALARGTESGSLAVMVVKVDAGTAPGPAWFTAALAAPVAEHRVEVDGAPVSYRRWGASGGRGIVLVHGGGAHARWWDHVAPFLADGHAVAAIDLTGHGDSGRRPSYSFDVWAREIMAVAADAGFATPPVVIGHSMGGLVALRLAALAGPAIEGAVVVDSPLRTHAPEEWAARRQHTFRQLKVYPDRETIIAHFRPVPEQPVLGYVADHVAATSVRPAEGGWTWKWDPKVFGRQEPHAPLTRLECRVALFRAQHGILSAEMSEIMYDRLGRVTPVVEIPAAGHHVMLDQPIALVAALRTLLSDWDHSLPAEARGDRA